MDKGNPATDPKGLIFEAFRIEGITASECRSIFLDWALSLPEGTDTMPALTQLIEEHGRAHPSHPMIEVMRAGLASSATPKRRGGWRSRPRD